MLKKRLFLALAVLLPLLGYAQAKSVPYFSQIGGASKTLTGRSMTSTLIQRHGLTTLMAVVVVTKMPVQRLVQSIPTTARRLLTTGWCRQQCILRPTRNTRFRFM